MSHKLFDDEYDPLAPPNYGEEQATDEPAEPAEPTIGGPGQIVRLRFEEGRLVSVRLAPNWYQRLAPGQSLAAAFQEAFLVGQAEMDTAPTEQLDLSKLEFEVPEFSEENLEAFAALLQEHSQKWQRAIESHHQQAPAPPAMGESQGVRVTLNPAGQPSQVIFNEIWAVESSASAISNAVLAATRRAYAAYEPVQDERDEVLTRYRVEHEILQEGFRRMLEVRGG